MLIILSECLVGLKVNDKWGFLDRTGKIIIEPRFDAAVGSFSEGLASVLVDGKYGFLNNTGIMIIKPQFDGVHDFSDGLAWVYRGSKSGLIINLLTK